MFLFHVRFEEAHGGFHRLSRLEDEGKLHLSGAEEVADRLHSVEEDVVDDTERSMGEHGFVEIFLEVRPSNKAALALYRKKGFHQVANRPSYYQARQGREDACVLAKKLIIDDQ